MDWLKACQYHFPQHQPFLLSLAWICHDRKQALPSALVDKVEIDVAELRIGDTIKVKDLSLAQDKDVHLVTDPEATVVTVTESHIAIADDEDSEETE